MAAGLRARMPGNPLNFHGETAVPEALDERGLFTR
jgi:hypothetical protein